MSEERRRFPAPWSVNEAAEAFCVVDATGFPLAYVYFDEAARGANSSRMMKDEARRIAIGMARLPELLTRERGVQEK